ncbi:aldo/keto reductase [uncultured Secundilactobacillus sp.]|uniref:aldo/keto reductase n=1 Tax=uncultured Secundilactobacillus sp. TaxID=2813935 RepID=UPI00258412F3|nr:aldo/keto reductase [uncultured Secundilactobacillus sp.]
MKKMIINHQSVPAIGLGTWHMGDNPQTRKNEISAIQAGLNAGARVIDTAEMYGAGRSESLVGEAIRDYSRETLFLISKVLPSNASIGRLEKSLDASLKRLQTDYLDLYLYHWRGTTPLAETVAELDRLTHTGKIRAWGVSNFDYVDMQELLQLPAGQNVAANEDLYNLGSRGTEVRLQAWQEAHQIPFIAYSPVGAGDSLGANMTASPAVQAVAERHQVSTYQVLLAWAIRNPNILAIPQTSDPSHAEANVLAGDLTLTKKDLIELDQAFPKPTSEPPLAIL